MRLVGYSFTGAAQLKGSHWTLAGLAEL